MKLSKVYYKDLFFTYLLSQKKQSAAAIVLLDGLPSDPSSKEKLIRRLARKGYDVFFPRYEGTWESRGNFLKRPPGKAIVEFIKALKTGVKIENGTYQRGRIFVLGASFGGGVALEIAGKDIADKVCALSPVISFKNVKGINTLEGYIRAAYSHNYRFESKNWQKLLKDKIWNLADIEIKKPADVLIIAGKADDQITRDEIENFGKKKSVKVRVYDFGHITLSKITKTMLEEILRFFSN